MDAPPFHVRFLRNYTVEPIQPWLGREFAARGLALQCSYGGYAETRSEVLALGSAEAPPSLLVLTMALEQFSADFGHAAWECAAACEHVLSLATLAAEHSRVPVVLNTVLPPLHPQAGFAVDPRAPSQEQHIDALNLALRTLAAERPGHVVLLDWGSYARELGAAGTYDQRFWHTSGLPFSARFLRRFATDIAGVAEVLAGRARKCIVLDCDNTLWGGVVGEDGVAGIRLSSASVPGAYFQQFQRSVLDLHARGVLVALCSKNNEADVFEVLDTHPDCLIRREHLAAWRIDWNDKAASLAQIASELNLAVDALVFVDDNPVECERIRQALPAIRVLPRPARAEELPGFLGAERPFPALVVTDADASRTATYRHNRERGALAALASDEQAYRRQLATRLRARPATAAELDRVAQLLQKTNQFNLTTRRHDRPAVAALQADADTLIHCADVGDRFGDLGLVAVAIARRDGDACEVDSFLFSCRALGRDAEYAFLACVVEAIAGRWPVRTLRASFVPTARNAQVADFWARAGFEPDTTAADGTRHYVATDLAALVERNRRPYITTEE